MTLHCFRPFRKDAACASIDRPHRDRRNQQRPARAATLATPLRCRSPRHGLPEPLAKRWFNRGNYGTVSHNAKAIHQRYLGWYDGNPADLNPLPAGTFDAPGQTFRNLPVGYILDVLAVRVVPERALKEPMRFDLVLIGEDDPQSILSPMRRMTRTFPAACSIECAIETGTNSELS